jgi:hypothetical protein
VNEIAFFLVTVVAAGSQHLAHFVDDVLERGTITRCILPAS